MKKFIISALFLCAALPLILPLAAYAAGGSVLETLKETHEVAPVFEENFATYTPTPIDGSKLSVKDYAINAPIARAVDVNDGVHGMSAYFEIDSNNDAEFYRISDITGEKILLTAEYKFDTTGREKQLLSSQEDSAPKIENILIRAGGDGKFKNSSGANFAPDNVYDTTKWYKIDVLLDMKNLVAETYIDNVCVERNIVLNANLKKLSRVTFFKQFKAANTHGIYVDNIGVYTLKKNPTASFEKAVIGTNDYTQADRIPSTSDDIYVKFTNSIKSETLTDKVRITQNNVPIAHNGILLSDGKDYKITLLEQLAPDTTYKIVFSSGITDVNNVLLKTDEILLKTKPNVASRIDLSCAGRAVAPGETITASVDGVYLTDAPTNEVLLMLVLYKDNRVADISYQRVTLTQNQSITATLNVPNDGGNYAASAFAWNNAWDMNAYAVSAR